MVVKTCFFCFLEKVMLMFKCCESKHVWTKVTWKSYSIRLLLEILLKVRYVLRKVSTKCHKTGLILQHQAKSPRLTDNTSSSLNCSTSVSTPAQVVWNDFPFFHGVDRTSEQKEVRERPGLEFKWRITGLKSGVQSKKGSGAATIENGASTEPGFEKRFSKRACKRSTTMRSQLICYVYHDQPLWLIDRHWLIIYTDCFCFPCTVASYNSVGFISRREYGQSIIMNHKQQLIESSTTSYCVSTCCCLIFDWLMICLWLLTTRPLQPLCACCADAEGSRVVFPLHSWWDSDRTPTLRCGALSGWGPSPIRLDPKLWCARAAHGSCPSVLWAGLGAQPYLRVPTHRRFCTFAIPRGRAENL